MYHIKKLMIAAALALTLASPASAYSDQVVLNAIDHRVSTLTSRIETRILRYRGANEATRARLRPQILGLIARKSQLLVVRHKVTKLPESRNQHFVSFFKLNVASRA